MTGSRFDDPELREWLGLAPGQEATLMSALRPALDAIDSALFRAGLDQRQAAFMVVTVMGTILAAQQAPRDRDRLMSEALLALDTVRDVWAKSQARRRPQPLVN